jgi:release factor glutamine methyltransferase
VGATAGTSGRPPPEPSGATAAVYPEREDTLLLAPFARAGPGRSVLDIGTGSGRLALEAARSGSTPVVATDRNPAALHELRRRARAEGVVVEGVRTDLASGLGRFDRVVSNPPYLPTRIRERDPDRWVNLALDGGPDGCAVLRRIVTRVEQHLRPGGRAYLLVSDRQSPRSLAGIRDSWRRRGGEVRVVAERQLAGERLGVWELRVRAGPATLTPRGRAARPRRGSGGRPRTRAASPAGSSPASGRGSTRAPGGASGRRRSPQGW